MYGIKKTSDGIVVMTRSKGAFGSSEIDQGYEPFNVAYTVSAGDTIFNDVHTPYQIDSASISTLDAWNEARKDLMNNGATVADSMLQRCLWYGNFVDLNASCVTSLLSEYPQN